ncbi:MAG: ComF family protein [Candidatus Parcubacteria bacterium]|nr:ComF family protein [Candidatus Parcubacteria bacterium]
MKNFKNELKKFKEFVLDLIFPKECIGCAKEGDYLCQQCLSQIELIKEFYCALCKKPSPWGKICESCAAETKIAAIWVATDYNQKVIQELIHQLKYGYIEEISAILREILLKYLNLNNILTEFSLEKTKAIFIPVPLHKKRLLLRGFNQSELIALQLKEATGIEVSNIIERIKNTQTQINLKRSERQQNVKEAFCLKSNFDNTKKAILIDDVITTGSTLKECAQALYQAGFTEIYGLVIAQRED